MGHYASEMDSMQTKAVDVTPFLEAQEHLRRLKDAAAKRLEAAEMRHDEAAKERDRAQYEFRSIRRAFDALNGISDEEPAEPAVVARDMERAYREGQ